MERYKGLIMVTAYVDVDIEAEGIDDAYKVLEDKLDSDSIDLTHVGDVTVDGWELRYIDRLPSSSKQ